MWRVVGVRDPAGPDLFGGTSTQTFPNRVYKASTIARDQAINYVNSIGLNHELFSPVGTDAINFNAIGIPASGLLTGQDCRRQPVPVVRQPRQQRSRVLTFMSKAFADMVVRMAFDNKVMSASNNPVYKPKLPAASEASKRFPVK